MARKALTFFDALRELSIHQDDRWMRPVGWRGMGQAYCIHEGRICIVPTLRGAVPYLSTDTKELLGEWELVSPTQVEGETRKEEK